MTSALKSTVGPQAGQRATTDTDPLQRLVEGVADDEQAFELINRYAGARYASLGMRSGHWFETTEEVYWYFLEQMPPLRMTCDGFVVCECVIGTLYHAFYEFDDRFFCALIDYARPGSFAQTCSGIKAQVRS